MKKMYLVVQHKDVQTALEKLREIGTVHVENQQVPFGSELIVLREEAKDLIRAISALSDIKKVQKQRSVDNWRDKLEETLEYVDQINNIEEAISKRKSRIAFWEPWGNFDPEEIRRLAQKGIYIQLCEINPKESHEIPEGVIIEKIFSSGGLDRCIAVSDKKFGLPYDMVSLPLKSLEEFISDEKRDEKKLKEAKEKLIEAAQYRDSFKDILKQMEDEVKFEEVKEGMATSDDLVYLKGFCPKDHLPMVQQKAQAESWALLIDEPTEEDNVPTLLKTPKWVEVIRPVFQMMNIVPGYKELDISLFFLLFFSIFTGILIGDAAYGLIFLAVIGFLHWKLGKNMQSKTVLFLGYVGSMSVVLWGVLTGTFFGQAWLPDVFQGLIPWLRETNNVISVCFIIGTIHLSIAHIWKIILKWPSLSALGEVGLLSLLWALFFVIRVLILDATFPEIGKLLFIVGPILILFFIEPSKNIFKAIGTGFGALLASVLGTFPDIISYIRLFAVGLASVAVADAFNSMASDVASLSLIGAAIVLLVGHVLNIILCLLAVLVHGVRLNVLEFACNHLSMEWKGIEFQPFKKNKI